MVGTILRGVGVTDVDTHIWDNSGHATWAAVRGGWGEQVGRVGSGGQSIRPGISDEGSFVDVRVECVPESRGSV